MKFMISAVLLLLSSLTIAADVAQERPSPEQVDNRIVFVGKLVSTSSAAKQVAASGDPHVMQLKSDAAGHYEAAILARDAGDLSAASDALDKAVHVMYAAVDAAGQSGKSGNDKFQRDFDNRRESTEALLSAHEMIALEKGFREEHRELQVVVARQLAEADTLRINGQRASAWEKINGTYETVRSAVEELRQGETLVRELKFASEEEEYLYELDRNDTHEMLIDLLLRDRPQDEARKQKTRQFRASAADLKREAENLASRGSYRDAINVLEQSTAELIKAIRHAGVYIPG